MDWIEALLGSNWDDLLKIPSWMTFLFRLFYIWLLFNLGKVVYETSMPIVCVIGTGSEILPIGSIALFENINRITTGDIVLSRQENKISFSSKPISEIQRKYLMAKKDEIEIYGRLFLNIPWIGFIASFVTETNSDRWIIALVIAFLSCGILGKQITEMMTRFWSLTLSTITLMLWAWIYWAMMLKFCATLPSDLEAFAVKSN